MSNLQLKAYPANYAEAINFLGNRVDKKLGHNTVVANYGNGSRIHVLYHGNVIATYYRDAGEVKNSTEIPVVAFRTAGWDTVTTCNRITMLLQEATRDDYRFYGVGIKAGQAELRHWTIDGPQYAQTLGGAAVNVYRYGSVIVKVDVEGRRAELSGQEAAELLPY